MKTYDRNRNAITTGSRVMVATNGGNGSHQGNLRRRQIRRTITPF